MNTAERYLAFAEHEARGSSVTYEVWSRHISGDQDVLELIERLPEPRRQPNLVLAAARHLGAQPSDYPDFRVWLMDHWTAVEGLARQRTTQTNEVGRTAVLLPALAQLTGPLSLIEVGASAGLCLYPDRFSYRYNRRPQVDPPSGPSPVVLSCEVSGSPPLPQTLPTVVHRSGVDLNPLDLGDPEDTRWLESLVWPGQDDRLARLRGAVDIARADPPHLARGDLNENVAELVEAAPRDSTVVVFESAVLAYLGARERRSFAETVRDLPCHWISNEAAGVVESVVAQLPQPPTASPGAFVLTLDETALAYAAPHGQSLAWFAEPLSG